MSTQVKPPDSLPPRCPNLDEGPSPRVDTHCTAHLTTTLSSKPRRSWNPRGMDPANAPGGHDPASRLASSTPLPSTWVCNFPGTGFPEHPAPETGRGCTVPTRRPGLPQARRRVSEPERLQSPPYRDPLLRTQRSSVLSSRMYPILKDYARTTELSLRSVRVWRLTLHKRNISSRAVGAAVASVRVSRSIMTVNTLLSSPTDRHGLQTGMAPVFLLSPCYFLCHNL